jgi:hypothetical protein
MDEPTSRYTSPDPAGSVPPQQPSPAGSVPPQQPLPAATPPPVQPAATPPPPVQPAATPPPPPQPTWRPPADRGGSASLIFGVIILIIGLWFFATRTLGLDLPDIEWGTLWPLLLIGLGAWIVFGAMRRNR